MTRELDGLLRFVCPRLSVLASRLSEAGLDAEAQELRQHAAALDAYRRHRSPTRESPSCEDTQPIGLDKKD